MAEKEEVVIVCLRVQDRSDVVRGSTQAPCSGCGCALWIAPTSQRMGYDKAYCFSCMLPQLRQAQGLHVELAPGAAEELYENLHPEKRN
jgi:hypothetical protein